MVNELAALKGELSADQQLLDNVAYNAFTSDDSIIPCREDIVGKNHVDENVMLAPRNGLEPFLKNCLQNFSRLPDHQKLVLVLSPPY